MSESKGNTRAKVFNTASVRQWKEGKTQQVWDYLVEQVIRRKLAEQRPVEIGASYMYFVSEGWEMNILKQSFKARIAVTASELDHLMGDQAIRAILIPYESPLSREMVEQICERHGSAKTIYYERGSS